MTRAGCFVLHVTCDAPAGAHAPGQAFRDEFTGETRADAERAAAASGWALSPRGVVPTADRCPACVRGASRPPDVGRLPSSTGGPLGGAFPPIIVRPK